MTDSSETKELKDLDKIRSTAEDAFTYGILSRDITGQAQGERTTAAASPSGVSLGALTQQTLRQVLGWRYRTDDPKGFTAALGKAFQLRQVGDHTEWDFKPQNYTVQADLGEISGAQASIYARARNALDQSLPLLDGLTSLRPDANVGDIEAMRSIVREELTLLVGELGQVGGPRVQRVDQLFSLLLGPEKVTDPAKVKGHLGQLKRRFGLDDPRVNRVEEEQSLTNFIILVDYVNSLNQTWTTQRDSFSRGATGAPFLGNQLVLLSQALDSLVESIQGSYDSFDSVFLGAAERQTTVLRFFKEAPITLAELLSWAEGFATREGRQLLQDAGKDGVVAFRAVVNQLTYLFALTVKVSGSNSSNPTKAFHTVRVRRSLQEVEQFLNLTQDEASKIIRHAVEDGPGFNSEPLSLIKLVSQISSDNTILGLTISGKGIRSGATVRLINDRDINDGFDSHASTVNGGDPDIINATFTFGQENPPPSPGQKFTIVVINPDGQRAFLSASLTIVDLPRPVGGKVTSDLTNVCAGGSVKLTLAGSVGQIQWQSREEDSNKFSNIDGATGATLTITPLLATTVFQAQVSIGTSAVLSNEMTVTVVRLPQIDLKLSNDGKTLSAIEDAQKDNFTYVWTVPTAGMGTGYDTITTQTVDVTSRGSGKYHVIVTTKNPIQCSAEGEILVAIIMSQRK